MKKFIKAITALVTAIGLVFTPQNVKADEKVTLVINYYAGAISDTIVEQAKEKFPEYNLEFNQVPADGNYDTKLKASLNSDAAPDIAAINSNIQDFAPYYDKFVNLLDYGTGELEDEYVEWKWDSTLAPDSQEPYQIAMPIDVGPTAMFYNVEAWEKAGLPTEPEEVSEKIQTLDDFMDAAKQMKEKADMPMFLSASGIFSELTLGMKKTVIEDGELTLADGELREYFDFVVEAIENDLLLNVYAQTGEGVNADQQGLYGAKIQASWGIADLRENGVSNEQWLVARAPGNPSNFGGSYLAAIKTTKHPEEAAEVIKFLTSVEAQENYYEERSLFPSAKALYTEEFEDVTIDLFGDHKFNKYFVESAEALEYTYPDPREKTALSYFEDQLVLVAEQGKDPEQAWEDAVREAEFLMEE